MEFAAGLVRASGRLLGRWFAAAFWPATTSRNLRFILASLPVQVAALAIIVLPVPTAAHLRAGKLVTLVLAFSVVVLVAVLPALSAAQRGLLRVILGADIPPPAAARRTTPRGLLAWLRAEATWRQLAYHVLVAPVLALAGLLMPFLWTVGITLAAIYAYVGLVRSFNLKFIEPGHTVIYGYLTVLGALLLLAAPRVGAAVIRLDTWAARALLGSAGSRPWSTGWRRSPRAGQAWWTRRMPSGGGSNGTCTTAPSSAWCLWPCTSAWPGLGLPTCLRTPGR